MVGLSIVLEDSNPQVINKTTMLINKPSSPSFSSSSNPSLKNLSKSTFLSPTFLNECFLCKRRLLPGNDIYMYRGDRAFCSVECRCRQILMDEEESIRKDNFCSDSSSSASRQLQQGKGNKNRKGRFVC